LDFQKRSLASSERDERRRGAFREEYVRSIVAERFVFVDECSTNISLSPIYARAPKGERACGKVPRNWGKNISLICAIDAEGVKPSMSVEGSVDGKAFESYIEHFLAPELKPGQIVVMDNLSVHKSKRVERLIEDRGATLLFLPPYSPDLNPIEEAFSKVKSTLRKVQARTRETLVEATGRALDAITRGDIHSFYADCGYRLPLQSL
jgi:transposase